MTSTVTDLYKVGKGVVEFVDVPEFGHVMIDGMGAPGGMAFTAAVQALYAVSYGAHFVVNKARSDASKVMPLKTLWWVDDPRQQNIIAAVALGRTSMADTDPQRWQWRAMIVQPDPVDAVSVDEAVMQARPGSNHIRRRRASWPAQSGEQR